MEDEHDWSDYPPGHVGPLPKQDDKYSVKSDSNNDDDDKEDIDLENDSIADDGSESSGISDVSGLIRKYSDLKIKNLTFPEFQNFYKILHNYLSLLTDSDEEMQTITKTIRECDRRSYERINSKSKSPIPKPLPPMESFFAANAPVYTESNIAQVSEASSTCGNSKDVTVCVGYDPSKWFFKKQKNPTPFVPGVKVSHPFTDDVKTFLSEGDRNKLRDLSVRKQF